MRRRYKAHAAAAAPPASTATDAGFPSEGDVSSGVAATVIGPYVFYMLTEAIVTVIEQAGLDPRPGPVIRSAASMRVLPPSGRATSHGCATMRSDC